MARNRGTFYAQTFRLGALSIAILFTLVSVNGCERTDTNEGVQLAKANRIKVNVFQPVRIENAAKTASYFGKLKANRSRVLGFGVGGKVQKAPEPQQTFASGAIVASLETETLLGQRTSLEREIANIQPGDRPEISARLKQQLGEIDLQIEQRTISAPFDCVVEKSFAAENGLVRPNAPVVSVVEATSPKIEIGLPRKIVKLIEFDRDYVFILDGERLEAKLRERSFRENPPGTVQAVFEISTSLTEIDFYLGQVVEARFSLSTELSGHWLPLSCLRQSSDGRWYVYVIKAVNEKNEVRQQAVDVASLTDDSVLVTSSLENQFVVLDGLHRIVPGQQVDLNLVSLEDRAAETGSSE